MNIIGLDPGLSGACAVLNDEPYVFNLPVELKPEGGLVKNMVCARALTPMLKYDSTKYIVALEIVGGRGGNAAQTIHSLGDSSGCLRGVCEALGFKVIHIRPQDWKEHFGLSGTVKDEARLKAIELYPDLPLHRKKDIDRADALLIATYAKFLCDGSLVDNLRGAGM